MMKLPFIPKQNKTDIGTDSISKHFDVVEIYKMLIKIGIAMILFGKLQYILRYSLTLKQPVSRLKL